MAANAEFHPEFSSSGDIVFQSSEGTKFRLNSAILKAASTVFEGMFAMPRDPNEPTDSPITLEEKTKVLSFMFNCVFPTNTTEHLQDYEEVWEVVEAAEKYDMPSVLKILKLFVLADVELREDSLKLFAVASHCGWRDVVRTSSNSSLSKDISNYQNIHILKKAKSSDVFSLLELHWKRKEVLKQVLGAGEAFEYMDYEDTYACREYNCSGVYGSWDELKQPLDDFRMRFESYIESCPLAPDLWTGDRWEKFGERIASLKCDGCKQSFYDRSQVSHRLHNLRSLGILPAFIGESGSLES